MCQFEIIFFVLFSWIVGKPPTSGNAVPLPPLPESSDELRSMTVIPYLDAMYNPVESDDDDDQRGGEEEGLEGLTRIEMQVETQVQIIEEHSPPVDGVEDGEEESKLNG